MNYKIVALYLSIAFTIRIGESAFVNNALVAKYLCRSRPDGFQTIVPGSCSQYYVCEGGKTLLETCSKFYDAVKNKCVSKNPGCVVTIRQPLDCWGPCCGIADNSYAVDPRNQQIYYLCKTNTIIRRYICPNDFMFDLMTLECAKPSVCSECTTRKPPCTTTTTPPCITTTKCTTTTPCTTTTSCTTTTPCTTTTKCTTTTPCTTTTSCTTTTPCTTTTSCTTTTPCTTTTSCTTTTPCTTTTSCTTTTPCTTTTSCTTTTCTTTTPCTTTTTCTPTPTPCTTTTTCTSTTPCTTTTRCNTTPPC